MNAFGFSFSALYRLEVGELLDIAHLILGEDHYLPGNKEVLIRGVIVPFLREASKSPKDASKDQVMRAALVKAAQVLRVDSENWDTADSAWMVRQVRRRFAEAFQRRLEDLSEADLRAVVRNAEDDLKKRARQMGVSLLPASGVLAGELSGFGVFLGTTTGLGALSSAIGVTFPWAMYQWATTVLGVMLGPIGWTLAAAGVTFGGIAVLSQWLRRNDQKLTVVVVAIVIAAGDNPYEWFGLQEAASLDEVHQAFRAMTKSFHPDLQPPHLPEWVKHSFNEHLLETLGKYHQIKKHKEGQP